MYQNRHPGPSHNQMKLPISDHLDRIRDEFISLQQQFQRVRMEAENLNQEKEAMQRQLMIYYEMACSATLEVAKNMEISKRMTVILQQALQFLPPEQQAHVLQAMERARNVSQQEAMAQLQQQQNPMAMLPNMGAPVGGPMMPPGFNPFLAAAAAAGMNIKPEDLNAMAAQFGINPKGLNPLLTNPMAAAMAAMPATTSHAPSLAASHNTHNSNHGTSRNNSRAASAASRPHSSNGTPLSKRPKTEAEDVDGDFEVDIQNEETASSSGLPAVPLVSSSHRTNGVNKTKDSDSIHSGSSRDSSATPKSSKQNPLSTSMDQSAVAAMASAMMPPNVAGDMAAIFGGRMPFVDARMVFPGLPANGKPPYAYKVVDGAPPQPVQFPPDALNQPDVPKNLTRLFDLNHGEVVCAVTISTNHQKVYTGGRGCVKVWDISQASESGKSHTAEQTIDCEIQENYIRSCKLVSDCNMLLVGGESEFISVIDLSVSDIDITNAFQTSKVIRKLNCEAQACYALAVSPDGKKCYSCCADGNILIWDLVTFQKIATLEGHSEGASCVDLASDGKTLWTGGLDSAVCTWDLAQQSRTNKFDFESQVFSLGCSPKNDFVAVGFENSNVEMLSTQGNEKYILHEHENCVLSLKFAHSGKWFVSTGKDSSLLTWCSPMGPRLVKTKESTSLLSCDISADDRYIITGSGEKRASVYEASF